LVSPTRQRKKIVLIRLDKIGDLISTLPVDQILDPAIYDVTWVVQKGMLGILQLGEKRRRAIEIDKSNPRIAKALLRKLLFDESFDVAISFQSPWWVNFQLFMAGIPKRIGPLSSWHSFLFLTEGLRQKRSQSIKHEFDYNLDLVLSLTGPLSENVKPGDLIFRIQKPHSSKKLEQFNLGSRFVVVHPGMAGSALNWPQAKYIERINELIEDQFVVAITGTNADQPYLSQIEPEFREHPKVRWLVGKIDLKDLVEVIYFSEFVIAPSTGVAHLTASVGKRLYSIFSPIKVHHPTRWGPRGVSPEQISIFTPDVKCPAQFRCLGPECPHFNCMEKIKIN